MDSVFVLATERAATMQALRKAAELTRESGTSIILIVPLITTFSHRDGQERAAVDLADAYRDLATRVGVNALVRVCACKRMKDIFAVLVCDPSTIVIGGRRRSLLWPTAEGRLADDLVRWGHRVVFEDIGRETTRGAGLARRQGLKSS
jgi:hypothetical protein